MEFLKKSKISQIVLLFVSIRNHATWAEEKQTNKQTKYIDLFFFLQVSNDILWKMYTYTCSKAHITLNLDIFRLSYSFVYVLYM